MFIILQYFIGFKRKGTNNYAIHFENNLNHFLCNRVFTFNDRLKIIQIAFEDKLLPAISCIIFFMDL